MWDSLRLRLTIIFIGLAIVPVAAVGVILTQRGFEAQQDLVLDSQRQVAQRVASEIDNFFGDVEADLYLIAGDLGSQVEADYAQQFSVLLGTLNTGPFRDVYSEFALLDADGQEQIRLSRSETISSDELVGRAGLPEYEEVMTDRATYFSPVWFDEETGEPFITLAIPLREQRSVEISGVLVADVRFREVRLLISGLQLGEGQNVFVMDSDSRIITHDDPTIVSSGSTLVLDAEAGRVTNTLGTDVLYATDTLQLGEVPLTIAAERATSEALASARNGVNVAIVVTVVALLVAVGLTTLIVWQVVRPIEALSAVAQSVREGNLSARAEVRRRDEIGQLADSFNQTAAQLQELIGNLEQRVADATRDLRIAAEVSQQVTRVLDMNELLPYLVNLTRDGFGLRHVSIFLYDDDTASLDLVAGSGSVGQKMLEAGKHFNLNDQGLVPLAARTYEPQIINDVTISSVHSVNPLLLDTRSEVALPMRVGTRLIGVLDMQSTEINHFTDDHVNVLTTLADQIAVAVRNASSFATAEEARAEAEQANIVKSQFLAAMSHELRTPLNAVLNFTQFVSSGMLGPINDEQFGMLNKVVHSGKHLLSLINDVLDISKIEAGALKLFVEDDLDIRKEAQSVVEIGKGMLNDKPVQLISHIPEKLPLMVGDKRRVRQIMLNLVSNACKFTEEGKVEIRLTHQGEHIQFAVTDSGPGIAPEDRDLVFETFRQTHSGLRQGEGTGLGLPISRRLAETHGGKLWFESTIGQGSTFYFTVPIHNTALSPLVKHKETSHVE